MSEGSRSSRANAAPQHVMQSTTICRIAAARGVHQQIPNMSLGAHESATVCVWYRKRQPRPMRAASLISITVERGTKRIGSFGYTGQHSFVPATLSVFTRRHSPKQLVVVGK